MHLASLQGVWGRRLLVLTSALLLSSLPALAGDQASVNLSVNKYGSSTSTSLVGSTGYSLSFQSEPTKGTIRLTLGSSIEFCPGTYATSQTATLIAGSFFTGWNIYLFKTEKIQPFFGPQASAGWAYMETAAAKSIGLTYAGILTAGAKISFSKRDDGMSLRLATSYRLARALISGFSGLELDALQLSFGLTF